MFTFPVTLDDKRMMRLRHSLLVIPLLLFFSLQLLEGVEPHFSIVDLSPQDRLLFSSQVEQPGWGAYEVLFQANLNEKNAIRALTHFPESSYYYSSTKELEIQNRFGLYRMSLDERQPFVPIDAHPQFAQGDAVNVGRLLTIASSPNGRWTVVQEPRNAVRGDLVLHDLLNQSQYVMAKNLVLEYRRSPALWSPDSETVLYSRDGKLYHYSVRQGLEGRVPDESYREFGWGNLSSVHWTSGDALYYLERNAVSVVRPAEFFARSFYIDPLPAGASAGILPVDFDPDFDEFWPSPRGDSLVLVHEGRSVFLFDLVKEGYERRGEPLPFLLLPRGARVEHVWWSPAHDLYVFAGGAENSDFGGGLYRLDHDANSFQRIETRDVSNFSSSPGGSHLALIQSDGISLRQSGSFDEVMFWEHPSPRSVHWISANTMLIVGAYWVEQVQISSEKGTLLALSQVDEVGEDGSGRLVAQSAGRSMMYEPALSRWTDLDESVVFSSGGRTRSLRHRVYLEPSHTPGYQNRIIVRTTDGFGNQPLFPWPPAPRSVQEIADQELDSTVVDARVFFHGPRDQGKRVALVFDAVDGDEGLEDILGILSDYGLRATFFVCGDFIRRHPGGAKQLGDSGHEIGSLFYTHMDMTDFRYRIDSDFVVRGLGRNEDEFHRASGKEVSTLWHAPWYVVSPSILDASDRMNYDYIGRDVDTLDWVGLKSGGETRDLYHRAPALVERILGQVQPGSIIPIRIGKSGEREDYLFSFLDLLINGLMQNGYAITNVGELRDMSR
ncbi:MAG: polysaccharide deacetylase family protein [Spirochaetales bacterium]|nr:polysaccharide deacetylase family protein [Spirochaetales bacterium]